MTFRELTEKDRTAYDKQATHVIQSWEWGEFRKKTGIDVVRVGLFEGPKLKTGYTVTFHKLPFVKKTVGYLPKGPMPTRAIVESLTTNAKRMNAAFVKLEPSVLAVENLKSLVRSREVKIENLGLVNSKKTLFTKYNFVIDLTKSEEELLRSFHQKTRYNIKVAQKKGAEVYESIDDKDFETYLKLYFGTTKRQKYFGHTPDYHRLMWETLKPAGMARLLLARYKIHNTKYKILVAWMLLNFGDTLYYPYGGSSTEYKEVMASNLVAWEAIKLGKKMGFKKFDMWGALGPEPDVNDPWYGFHRFKAGYGGKLVEYVGTYDLVLDPFAYNLFNVADRIRWLLLRSFRLS